MQRPRWFFLGLLVLVLAVAGLMHALRAAWAQRLYYASKYGSMQGDAVAVVSACERAHRFYSFNYYFPMLAAQVAYDHAVDLRGEQRDAWMESARRWSNAAYRRNPYRRGVVLVRARLLLQESPREALRFWRDYLDWCYWVPYYHALMAELFARNGDFTQAFAELKLIRGFDEYEPAAQRVQRIWMQEMTRTPAGATADRSGS